MASNNGRATPERVALLPDEHALPNGGSMKKTEVFGWEVIDRPGKYLKISKHEIKVDQEYQRDNIRAARINRIASRFSWVRFGCLLVAKRPDGTFWVFDGQHRKLAADKQSDIDLLPCLVFESTGPTVEANFFLDVNSDRSSLTMLDRFKALISSQDETAIAVQKMVTASKYRIQRGGTAQNTVQCVGLLYRCMVADPKACQTAWNIAVDIHDGNIIMDRVFLAIYAVERHVAKSIESTLTDARFRAAVERIRPKAVINSIRQTAEFYGKGGPKIYGESLVRLLNKGRRTNLIPSLYVQGEDDAGE